jgi:hypothetical protein
MILFITTAVKTSNPSNLLITKRYFLLVTSESKHFMTEQHFPARKRPLLEITITSLPYILNYHRLPYRARCLHWPPVVPLQPCQLSEDVKISHRGAYSDYIFNYGLCYSCLHVNLLKVIF